jgi:hypothetical protein
MEDSKQSIYLTIWQKVKNRKNRKGVLADCTIYLVCLAIMVYSSGLVSTLRYAYAAILFVTSVLFFIDSYSILRGYVKLTKAFTIQVFIVLVIHGASLLWFDLEKYGYAVLGGFGVFIISSISGFVSGSRQISK